MAVPQEYAEGPDEHEKKAPPDRPVVIRFEDHKSPTPRAPRGVQWISLQEGSVYADHQIRVRLRYPDYLNREFSSGSFARLKEALKQVVLEHSGWADPDSEDDSSAILPPVDAPCAITSATKQALDEDAVLLKDDMAEAKNDGERAIVRAEHDRTVAAIYERDNERRRTMKEPCCFWDCVSQEEIILMLRAVNEHKGKLLASLLETKPD